MHWDKVTMLWHLPEYPQYFYNIPSTVFSIGYIDSVSTQSNKNTQILGILEAV